MTNSRTIVVAGAGIGGLTAALALAARGYRVAVLEQAPALEGIGAGIQLSPNATRVLIGLGLGPALKQVAVVPEALVVRSGRNGRTIVRMPLGSAMEARYGAPYWVLHRGDLHAALVQAATAHPDIAITPHARVEDFAVHPYGVTVQARRGPEIIEDYGIALVGADGLWSALRQRIAPHAEPRFRRRTAWRALLPVEQAPARLRAPLVQLWLGRNAHLVHYPVAGGTLINIVAIARDFRQRTGWSAEASRRDLLARFPFLLWSRHARALLKRPDVWRSWALYDLPPVRPWGEGPVTLLGDAAHPMLPFLAQGAAMAIEDAAVLAAALGRCPGDPAGAFRAYEAARQARVSRVQRAARGTGAIYHLAGAEALARNVAMQVLGGARLIARYDWIYRWRAEAGDGNGEDTTV